VLRDVTVLALGRTGPALAISLRVGQVFSVAMGSKLLRVGGRIYSL